MPLLDAVPPIAGQVGRPRRRPDCLQGDRGYDDEGDRAELRHRHIEPMLAKRRTPNGSGLGKLRWYIERTLSWMKQFRRVRLRTANLNYSRRLQASTEPRSIPSGWVDPGTFYKTDLSSLFLSGFAFTTAS